jgi:hypothetical protein
MRVTTMKFFSKKNESRRGKLAIKLGNWKAERLHCSRRLNPKSH